MSRAASPPEGRVLVGPFLTEDEFEHRVHARPGSVRGYDFLLRIGGLLSVEPAYPALQLEGDAVRSDVAWLTAHCRHRMGDVAICDWLVRHTPALGGLCPLEWLERGMPLEETLRAMPAA